MDTKAIGETLVDLCLQGKNLEAVDTLYADERRERRSAWA